MWNEFEDHKGKLIVQPARLIKSMEWSENGHNSRLHGLVVNMKGAEATMVQKAKIGDKIWYTLKKCQHKSKLKSASNFWGFMAPKIEGYKGGAMK